MLVDIAHYRGRGIAQAATGRLPTAAARVRAQVRSCGICGRQSGTGQVFSKYFGFPCQFSFNLLLHIHHLSSGAGTIGQLVTDEPSGLSLTPPQETKLAHAILLRRRCVVKAFLQAAQLNTTYSHL
jgi:hypothetical protein